MTPSATIKQELLDATEFEQRSTMANGNARSFEAVESDLSRAGAGRAAFQSSSMSTVRQGTDEYRPRSCSPSATEAPPSNMKDVQVSSSGAG